MRPYLLCVVVLSMVASVGLLTGCGVDEGLVAMRDQAEQMHARIEADRATLLESAGALPEDDLRRARIEAVAMQRGEQSESAAMAIDRLDALIASAEAGDVSGTIESGVGAVLPILPPGAQLPVLLAGGLAASLWRAMRLKKSALSIAEGLDKAMRDDDGLRDGVKRNSAVLRSVQTRTARRIVDEATKKDTPMVRLPI